MSNEWISVNSQEPDDIDECWVYTGFLEPSEVLIGTYLAGVGIWDCGEDREYYGIDSVSHWMPSENNASPSPPEGEK